MNKNKYTYLEKVPARPTPAGDRFETEYKLVQEDSNLSLVEVGKIDVQEKISSYEDGVSLPRLIARYQAGDTSVFAGDSGFYGDVSEMPRNLQDAIHASRANYVKIQNLMQQIFDEKQKAAATETAVDAVETTESEVKQDA